MRAQKEAIAPWERALGGVPTQPGPFSQGRHQRRHCPRSEVAEPLSLQGPGSGRHHPWPVGTETLPAAEATGELVGGLDLLTVCFGMASKQEWCSCFQWFRS